MEITCRNPHWQLIFSLSLDVKNARRTLSTLNPFYPEPCLPWIASDTSSANKETTPPTGNTRNSGRVAAPASLPWTNNWSLLLLTTLTLSTVLKQPSTSPNRTWKRGLLVEINRWNTSYLKQLVVWNLDTWAFVGYQPQSILMGHNFAVHNAVATVWPSTTRRGCNFHYHIMINKFREL